MRDIFSVSLVVLLFFFTRTHSKELQSNDSTPTCKVGMVKVIPLQTEASFKELALFNGNSYEMRYTDIDSTQSYTQMHFLSDNSVQSPLHVIRT